MAQDAGEVGPDTPGAFFGKFGGKQMTKFVEIFQRSGKSFIRGKVVPVFIYSAEKGNPFLSFRGYL